GPTAAPRDPPGPAGWATPSSTPRWTRTPASATSKSSPTNKPPPKPGSGGAGQPSQQPDRARHPGHARPVGQSRRDVAPSFGSTNCSLLKEVVQRRGDRPVLVGSPGRHERALDLLGSQRSGGGSQDRQDGVCSAHRAEVPSPP